MSSASMPYFSYAPISLAIQAPAAIAPIVEYPKTTFFDSEKASLGPKKTSAKTKIDAGLKNLSDSFIFSLQRVRKQISLCCAHINAVKLSESNGYATIF